MTAICKREDRTSYRVTINNETVAIIEILTFGDKQYFAPRYPGAIGSDGCHETLEKAMKVIERKIGRKVVLVEDDIMPGNEV